MGIDIDIAEVRALGSRIQAAGGRVGAKGSAALRATAARMKADAQALAPVGATGELQREIDVRITGDGRTGGMTVEVVASSDHAFYQEFGTSVMPAQPFIGPAFDRSAPGYTADLARIAEQETL